MTWPSSKVRCNRKLFASISTIDDIARRLTSSPFRYWRTVGQAIACRRHRSRGCGRRRSRRRRRSIPAEPRSARCRPRSASGSNRHVRSSERSELPWRSARTRSIAHDGPELPRRMRLSDPQRPYSRASIGSLLHLRRLRLQREPIRDARGVGHAGERGDLLLLVGAGLHHAART